MATSETKGSGSRGGRTGGGGSGGESKNWIDSLSDAEKDAVSEYTTSRYQSINSGLRSENLSKADQAIVAQLDAALDKSRLSKEATLFENQKLYRAADIPEVNAALKSGKIEGLTYTDKGFVSTTRDAGVARSFKRSNDAQLFVIHAPKGTKAADVEALSAFGKGGKGKGESETLLARNMTFRVSKVERVKEKYQTRDLKGKTVTRTRTQQYIHVDVIGQ